MILISQEESRKNDLLIKLREKKAEYIKLQLSEREQNIIAILPSHIPKVEIAKEDHLNSAENFIFSSI